MEKVLGIGGLFFRAKNPEALAKWYTDMLGVASVPEDYDSLPWRQAGGSTAFAPFAQDTSYFGDPDKHWMINFRVSDLDRMLTQLKAARIAVEYEGDFPNGRFARLNDPEGNPIQLWQPDGVDCEVEES